MFEVSRQVTRTLAMVALILCQGIDADAADDKAPAQTLGDGRSGVTL